MTEHYGLDAEEIEQAKAAVRADVANALVSFKAMDDALQFRYTGTLPTISHAELETLTRSGHEKRLD